MNYCITTKTNEQFSRIDYVKIQKSSQIKAIALISVCLISAIATIIFSLKYSSSLSAIPFQDFICPIVIGAISTISSFCGAVYYINKIKKIRENFYKEDIILTVFRSSIISANTNVNQLPPLVKDVSFQADTNTTSSSLLTPSVEAADTTLLPLSISSDPSIPQAVSLETSISVPILPAISSPLLSSPETEAAPMSEGSDHDSSVHGEINPTSTSNKSIPLNPAVSYLASHHPDLLVMGGDIVNMVSLTISESPLVGTVVGGIGCAIHVSSTVLNRVWERTIGRLQGQTAQTLLINPAVSYLASHHPDLLVMGGDIVNMASKAALQIPKARAVMDMAREATDMSMALVKKDWKTAICKSCSTIAHVANFALGKLVPEDARHIRDIIKLGEQ